MDNCVFCKIIKGELPSLKIYEDENTLVFLDISEDVDGHMLAIPKNHCKNILDCKEKDLIDLMKTVKLVSNNCVDNCGYEGVNLLNASDETAGQSVNHFHIHIIPRKNKDNIETWPNFTGARMKREDIYEILRIKKVD